MHMLSPQLAVEDIKLVVVIGDGRRGHLAARDDHGATGIRLRTLPFPTARLKAAFSA
jgi:hypothetical protein